ncbi:MAG: T9SS type A sorting domain-containing protein [Puia sp.]|nr:T9SS type A sorting domain-containing protein [Puia sp.]
MNFLYQVSLLTAFRQWAVVASRAFSLSRARFSALFILGAGLSLQTRAQSYYPGGLGNGSLKLWLDGADQTTLLNTGGTQAGNGNFIAKWMDKSSNNNHAVQATAGAQPIQQSASLNGYAGVLFQNANEYLTGPSAAYQTIVSVRSMPGTGHYQTLFASPANTDFSIRGGGASSGYTDGPNAQDWCYNTGTTPTQWLNGVQTLNGSNTNQILVSSAAAATGSTYSINSTVFGNTRAMNTNDPVYELLSYSATLSVTQREILENYEAVKWGLESLLPTSAYPVFNPPSLTSYYKNLVGIGYTSSTDNFLANAAASIDGLGFSSGSGATDFLNTYGFAMAAHNGQANTSLTNVTISGIGTGLNRWNRSWDVQTVGGNGSGNITLNFNFNSYNGGSLPGGSSNYYLLYNATDGSFATGTNSVIAVSSSASGSNVAFTVKASSLATGYYTILWTSPTTKLITPGSNSLCAGGNVSYAALTATGFTYQWQVNKGSGFANVPATDPGGAVYGGATTAVLSITGVTAGMSGYTYQCVLTPSVGLPATVGPASLTVNANPAVAAITGTASLTPGATATLTDATTGGVWSSSATSVATVNGSGAVTGIAYGSTTVSYTVTGGGGCATTVTQAVNVINSHYFPGGLGNTNLKLWLDGADGASVLNPSGSPAANGDFAATWMDKSGNSNNAVQTMGGAQPLYETGQLNGNAALQFQTTNEYLAGPSGAYQTIVSTRNMPGAGHYQTLFASPANTDFSIRGGGATSSYTDGPNGNDWVYNTGATSTQWLNGVQTLNGSNSNQILVSAAAAPTNANYSVNSTFTSRGMNGTDDVYELLAYNTTLNTTQRHILENYNAAKWGLGSLLPAVGYTVFTPPTASTYNKNLVGIGYTSSTDNFLANPVAASNGSTDGLGLSSGTGASDFLNVAGYVMAAHNGQAATIITNPATPAISTGGTGSLNLWNRSWYLQKTGGLATGVVTLNFNFSDYNFSSLPSTTYIYGLLYNATDGTFATGTTALVKTTATALSASNVGFTVKAANLANGYYTLVWSTSNTLPILLVSFTAAKQGSSGLLQWSSSQDRTGGYFEIERQSPGQAFLPIGEVAADSSAGLTAQYSFRDNTPAPGLNSYRLRITDADGDTHYSDVRTLDFDAGQSPGLSLYPNPVTDLLQVSTENLPAPFVIRMIAIGGQIVRSITVSTGTLVSIPVKDLPAGIYLVEIRAGGTRYTREILKH